MTFGQLCKQEVDSLKNKELYKDTEVGRIPVDWEVKKLQEIFDITAGGDLRKDMYSKIKDDIHVYPIYSNGLDNKGLYGYSSNYDYTEEAITVTARGTIGYAIYRDHKFCAIGRVLVLKPKLKINNFFVSQYINNNIEFTIENTGVPQLTAPKISVYKIPLPPLPEQKAIAKVLSDIDELIESIEKLIHKKKQIKQGAMQELLTGKKRLPGFSGKWEVKRLGELGVTYSGLSGKKKEDFNNGNSYYITFLNVLNNPVIDLKQVEKVRVSKWENQNLVRKGDIFFNTSSETPEEVGMCSVLMEDKPNLYLNSFCFGYRLYDGSKCDALYLTSYLRSDLGRKMFSTIAQGSTRYNLSKKEFNNIAIPLPPLPEQKAIAQILSDMDAEIEALEKKLDKYRKIKEGMMEKLLTGQVRLV